jgi:purine nucleosidase
MALIRMANEAPSERTLIAIGPLTNVALATRLDPTLPSKYRRLVWMGGAVWAEGNIGTHPSAEFNAWSDPEAAAIVLETWPGMSRCVGCHPGAPDHGRTNRPARED